MITTHTNAVGTTWKIAISPSKAEIQTIMHEMNIGDEYLEELQTPTPQPVCMDIQGTTYAVFHIPVHKKTDPATLHYVEEEVDVLIRDNTIITICYSPLDILNIDVEYAMSHNPESTAAELWWHLITHIYKTKHSDVDALVLHVKELREKIFTDKEHIETISDIHRAYLAIDFPIAAHGDIIESMYEQEQKHGLTKKSNPRVWTKLRGELHRLTIKLDKLGAYIHELRDTQSTLINARQNRLIQTFTILTFVFLPINFLAAVFGMNVIHMPIVQHPMGFWILLGGFVALSSVLLSFFKMRRWL
ncbi:MAG: CorA family divalent cation transporter [Patescibacteria group bacterium]